MIKSNKENYKRHCSELINFIIKLMALIPRNNILKFEYKIDPMLIKSVSSGDYNLLFKTAKKATDLYFKLK